MHHYLRLSIQFHFVNKYFMKNISISLIAIIAAFFTVVKSEAQQGTKALVKQEVIALEQALDDEYKAWTMYGGVIKDFGAVRPFVNIREAESRHIEALLSLFKQYGIQPSKNRWVGNVPKFATLNEACKAGITAEIENVALYDKLLASTNKQDILHVYHSLRAASKERHLPAFRRCAE
jgi:hypothetical protein